MSDGIAYTVRFEVQVADDLAGSLEDAAIIAAEMIGTGLVPEAYVIDHEVTELNGGRETGDTVSLF